MTERGHWLHCWKIRGLSIIVKWAQTDRLFHCSKLNFPPQKVKLHLEVSLAGGSFLLMRMKNASLVGQFVSRDHLLQIQKIFQAASALHYSKEIHRKQGQGISK